MNYHFRVNIYINSVYCLLIYHVTGYNTHDNILYIRYMHLLMCKLRHISVVTDLNSLRPVCSPSFSPYWNPALLGQLEKLSTLILDGNNYTSHIRFPYMLSVTTVCINKNKLNNLPVFVEEVRRKFPNIK